MTSFTKSQLLKRISSRQKAGSKGFSLVELMIAVSIIGMFSSVAIPKYLNVRNSADSKIKIAEALDFARECATFQIVADPKETTVQNPGGTTTVSCGGTLTNETILSRAFTLKPGQTYTCLDKTIDGGANIESKAEILISPDGDISCEFALQSGDVYPPDGTING